METYAYIWVAQARAEGPDHLDGLGVVDEMIAGRDRDAVRAELDEGRQRHMLTDDAVDVGDVVLQCCSDLVHVGVEPGVDRAGGADHHDLFVRRGIERPRQRVGRLQLAGAGDEPVEAGQVIGKGDEFGGECGDEESHRPIMSRFLGSTSQKGVLRAPPASEIGTRMPRPTRADDRG